MPVTESNKKKRLFFSAFYKCLFSCGISRFLMGCTVQAYIEGVTVILAFNVKTSGGFFVQIYCFYKK